MEEIVLKMLKSIHRRLGERAMLRLLNELGNGGNTRKLSVKFSLPLFDVVMLLKNERICLKYITDQLLPKQQAVILPFKRSA